ncbi:hypothetical protein E1B28_004545 [Marasmius oreades]|uniref:CcmS related domain-containing protein n=1 Tax=Marasmius oreades TaxID=181124 RepID=A0A9P8AD37_9AGAR|nr:uncharacterized protein E1B28_004545 [Marasmius oreades]KAG7097169.1 hypothetical protein E1B28_004545 [Marasmius oreades]
MAKPKKGKQKNETVLALPVQPPPLATHTSPVNPPSELSPLPPPALGWPSPNLTSLNINRQTKKDNDDGWLPTDGVLEEGLPTIKKANAKSPLAASPWGVSQQTGSIPSAQATKATIATKNAPAPATSVWGGSHHPTGKVSTWHQQAQSTERPSWDTGGAGWHTSGHDAWGADDDSESESESEAGDGRGSVLAGGASWGQPKAASFTPGTSTWRSWGDEAQRNSKVNSFATGVTGSKNALSSQQRSQILDSLLNVPQSHNNYVAQHKQAQAATQQAVKHFPHVTPSQAHAASRHTPRQHPNQSQPKRLPHISNRQATHSSWHTPATPMQQSARQEVKSTKEGKSGKHRRSHSEDHWGEEWGGGGGGEGGGTNASEWWTPVQGEGTDSYGWGPIPEEEEEDYEDARRVHFSPKAPSANLWGDGGKSPVWGGGKLSKAESVSGWGTDGDGWVGTSDKTNGWGLKPPQGNSPWSTWGEDESQSDSPWGMDMKEENSPWSLLERPKAQAPGISSARPHDKHSEASYSIPSRTLAHAYKGTTTTLHGVGPENSIIGDYMHAQIQDSGFEALEPVQRALFGKGRRARERIHWMFPPDKDERVEILLTWIQNVSYSLATYGVHKFLQTRERGALFANADFRLPGKEKVPAFDWLTFDELQRTRDKILQESVVCYDPAAQVIVFVFLSSNTGNSVAMWRRKIPVPNNTRLSFQAHINQALAGLRRDSDYIVHVDELPNDMPPITRSRSLPATTQYKGKKKKRKWWRALFGL